MPGHFRYDDDNVSLISMRELPPSPIDDESPDPFAPTDDENVYPDTFPPPSPPLLSRASTYASTRGPAFWLHRSQKYSSYLFLSFLGVHGATVAASPLLFGISGGNASVLLARTYFYQSSPLLEGVLIPGALGLHIASGLGLRAYRHFQQRQRYGGRIPTGLGMWRWRNFSTVAKTGVLAIPGVALHAGLLRAVPLWVDGDSSQIGLEYLAHGFWAERWGKIIGGVFYAGFVGAVSYHVCYGLAVWWKVSSPRKRRRVGLLAAGTAAVWLSGLVRVVVGAGGKQGGYLGRHYDKLYAVFFRRIGS